MNGPDGCGTNKNKQARIVRTKIGAGYGQDVTALAVCSIRGIQHRGVIANIGSGEEYLRTSA